jgi:N-acetylglucosamine-6-phosphate deacetylase
MRCCGRDVSTSEWVAVEGAAAIQSVDSLLSRAEENVWLAPGFIDLQVNGFAGVDYNAPAAPHEAIERSIRALFSTGVTRFLPTVITGSQDAMLGALRNLARARALGGPMVAMEGFHVEGPHISPEDGPRGAHPRQWVRPPDLNEYRRWQEATDGAVKLVTLAPEWPGAPRYIEQLAREGVVASIGHTRATAQQIRDAVSAGAALSTHLGNGADAVLPRHPNYIWDQLAEDRLAASFIADGLHLPDAFLKSALRAKGIERSILVTDAVMPAMCPPGPYRFGEVEVDSRADGRVVLRGGTRLAGSNLRMDQAIANVMRVAGLSLTEAVAMATINPARVGRVRGRLRGLNPGERADVIRFRFEDGQLRILETYVSGESVFTAPPMQ